MGKKNRKKQQSPHHTPLSKHERQGSRLLSPLSKLNMKLIDWPRDLLPEHLWIAALASHFGIDRFHHPYNAFLDAFDPYWPHEFVAIGTLSDFAQIPSERRGEFVKNHHELIRELFFEPIGRMLAYYPEGPAQWLLDTSWLSRAGSLDPEVDLPRIRSLVVQLLPGKDEFCGRIRAVPLCRLLKHGKLHFFADMPVVKLMPKYPVDLNDDERYHVESVARSTINMMLQMHEPNRLGNWAQYFWRHNYDLTECRPREATFAGRNAVSADQGIRIEEAIGRNAKAVRSYIQQLRTNLRPDLYDPARDEILFGLFTRIARLYLLLCEDVNLWARDVSGIVLRCIADSAISFGYLVTSGTKEDVRRFIEYGEGQQKLLMLHLQDNYPDARSVEGLSSEDLASISGSFQPELIDIELGHWTKKDTRRLASEAGMDRLYRLVFSPTSSDVHGTWFSLKNSNLIVCKEPLHRFHRLPHLAEPPFFVDTALVAQALYEHCLKLGVDRLGYPRPQMQLTNILDWPPADSDDERSTGDEEKLPAN